MLRGGRNLGVRLLGGLSHGLKWRLLPLERNAWILEWLLPQGLVWHSRVRGIGCGVVINLLDVDVLRRRSRLFLFSGLDIEGLLLPLRCLFVLWENREAFPPGEEIDEHDHEFNEEHKNPVYSHQGDDDQKRREKDRV